jgi:hypothetical protein
MRFIYRGVRYEATPATLATQESEIGGKYRGAAWRTHTLIETPAPQPIRHLKYRGVPYTIGDVAIDRVDVASATVPQAANLAGASTSRILPSMVRAQVDRLHRANIQHNIEHRLEVAKAQHNNVLVALLEREFEEALCR